MGRFWGCLRVGSYYTLNQSVESKLKNGLTTLLKEMGPEWEEMIEQLGIEKETAELVNLNLNSFGGSTPIK